MKYLSIAALGIIFLLTSTGCEKESPFGHLKVTVNYPEAVVVPDQPTYFITVPGVGAEVRLYDKDAHCLGIRDARIDVAWIEDDAVFSLYAQRSNTYGEVLFTDIPAGEYYLVVFARQLTKYTEKYIEVYNGDTLELSKSFTEDGAYYKKLEPWDHTVPPY